MKGDGDILRPVIHQHDGWPDLCAADGILEFIAGCTPVKVHALLDLCDKAEAERDAALAELDEHREMSGCMDLLRRDLIEAGVIGDACPPLFMTEAIIGYFGQLRADLEACRKDAERYRWIRERVGVDFMFGDYNPYLPGSSVVITQKDKETTDAAIDAAMSLEANHA